MERQTKKPTNAQLIKRISRAVMFIDRTKDTKEVFFDDKGLRLTVTDDVVVVATGFHRHVFSKVCGTGYSRPYLYISRFVDSALKYGLDSTKNEYSYEQVFIELKKLENQNEYNIAVYVDWYLFNIFAPLYDIGESPSESFMTYERYVHNIARNAVLLKEKTEDMTTHQFTEEVLKTVKETIDTIPDTVLFKKLTDDELIKQEMSDSALQAMDDSIKAGGDGTE